MKKINDEIAYNPSEVIYDHIVMDSFAKRYQHLHDKMESWEEYDDRKVIIKMRDGCTYLYDFIEKRVRPIRIFDYVSELTDYEWRMGFSYFLNEALWKSDMSQGEFAEKVGIHRNMVVNYISRKSVPSSIILQRMAEELDCDVQDILPHDFVPVK